MLQKANSQTECFLFRMGWILHVEPHQHPPQLHLATVNR